MNKDIVQGKWKEIKGEIQQAWGKLTNDELDKAQGNATELAGLLQKKYGLARDEANQKIEGILERFSDKARPDGKSKLN